MTTEPRQSPFLNKLAGVVAAIAVATLSACSSNSAQSRYILAEKLWMDGKYAAAVGEFEKVVQKDPKSKLGLQALFRAGMTEGLYLNRHADAIAKFRRYVELDGASPTGWDAQKQIGEILYSKLELYRQAIYHYRALLKQNPAAAEAPEFLFRIAKSQFFLWQFDDAVTSYDELIRKFPEHPWAEKAAYEIGVTHFTRGDRTGGGMGQYAGYQQAIDAFKKFVQKYPASRLVPEARFGIAACLEEMDQLDAAQQEYEALRTSYPSPKVILIKLYRIKERKMQRNR